MRIKIWKYLTSHWDFNMLFSRYGSLYSASQSTKYYICRLNKMPSFKKAHLPRLTLLWFSPYFVKITFSLMCKYCLLWKSCSALWWCSFKHVFSVCLYICTILLSYNFKTFSLQSDSFQNALHWQNKKLKFCIFLF